MPKETSQRHIKVVLVVEDETPIGDSLVQIICSETPHCALLATNAFQAEEQVKTLMPDLFLLDHRLPKMSGLELYDRLHSQEAFQHIPAIFMTANLSAYELEQRGVTLIKKPFNLNELLDTINTVLENEPC